MGFIQERLKAGERPDILATSRYAARASKKSPDCTIAPAAGLTDCKPQTSSNGYAHVDGHASELLDVLAAPPSPQDQGVGAALQDQQGPSALRTPDLYLLRGSQGLYPPVRCR